MGSFMLTVLKNNQWDVEGDDVYFETPLLARTKGIEIINRIGSEACCIRKISGAGYYRTVGYFNRNNEYIR